MKHSFPFCISFEEIPRAQMIQKIDFTMILQNGYKKTIAQ